MADPPATRWRVNPPATGCESGVEGHLVADVVEAGQLADRDGAVVGVEELDEGSVDDGTGLGPEGATEGVVGPEHSPGSGCDGTKQPARRGELAEVEAGFDL